ncbi:MAG: D-alanyl-D-alanine carboxypeptidase/D-alanyl-D-alanine-endopeptidase [Woeseiaceae bacterium]
MKVYLAMALALVCTFAAAADKTLPPGVQHTLKLRNVPADTVSIYVQDVDSGEVLLSWLPDEPRNPASSIKLLTTLVALDLLGPAYQWETNVYAFGNVENGRLKGDLAIKGHGDPFLVTERVWQMLRNLRSTGIRHIDGDLLLDDSYFDLGDHDPAAFDRQPLRAYNVAPNALLMNFKVVRYWFEPASDTNKVNVRIDPPLENLQVENRLSLAPGSCSGYQRGITITPNEDVDMMIFSGRFPSGCERYAMDRTALSHNEFSYGLIKSLWQESGGTISGGWKNVVIEEDVEPLLEFRSRTLAETISRINKYSNNVMARQLLFTLSAEVLGAPGTEEGGRQVVENWLREHKISSAELVLDNGAGLSRDSRITAKDMAAMLRYAWQQPYMPEYLASMSLAGLDGTLRRRFRNAGLDGKAHMKTGSLDDVSALAGYLQARSGRRFSVVTLHNHKDIHRGFGDEVQEALLRWLYEQ